MADLSVLGEIDWRWHPYLPKGVAARYRPPTRGRRAEVGIKPEDWEGRTIPERRELAAHEVAHHLTYSHYAADEDRRTARQRAEARAQRAELLWWVNDQQVDQAIEVGCRTWAAFACRWGVTPRWAARRLTLYQQQHPGWQPPRRCA